MTKVAKVAAAKGKAVAEKSTDDRFKIKAEVMWAYLSTRNEMSGKYQVDLCKLSPAAVNKLESLGIEVAHKEDKGFYITAKSANFPILTVFPDNTPLQEGVKVGNGSKVTAVIKPFDWKFKNKAGTSAGIAKLILNELVEFHADDDDDDVEDVDGDIADMESDEL